MWFNKPKAIQGSFYIQPKMHYFLLPYILQCVNLPLKWVPFNDPFVVNVNHKKKHESTTWGPPGSNWHRFNQRWWGVAKPLANRWLMSMLVVCCSLYFQVQKSFPKRYPGIDKIVDQTQVRKSLPSANLSSSLCCIAAKLRFAHSIWLKKIQVDVLNCDEYFARKQKITL